MNCYGLFLFTDFALCGRDDCARPDDGLTESISSNCGLHAARELSVAGRRVTVLEAPARVGIRPRRNPERQTGRAGSARFIDDAAFAYPPVFTIHDLPITIYSLWLNGLSNP